MVSSTSVVAERGEAARAVAHGVDTSRAFKPLPNPLPMQRSLLAAAARLEWTFAEVLRWR